MLFSIIVPIYKVEKYLSQCIDSILAQTFKDFEAILIDDGSPDSCGEICNQYALKDNRIKVLHKENGGISDARNEGIKIAQGEYLVFLDSDDAIFDENVLMKLNIKLLETEYPDVLLERPINTVKLNTCDGEHCLTMLLSYEPHNVVVWNKIYKRAFIISNALYFVKGYVHEDDYWTPITIAKARSCNFIDFPICFHRINDESITRSLNMSSIERRIISKIHMNYLGAHYCFKNIKAANMLEQIYEAYFARFLSGIAQSRLLKEKERKKRVQSELKRCKEMFIYAGKTRRKSYRILSQIYKLFGLKIVLWTVHLYLKKGVDKCNKQR